MNTNAAHQIPVHRQRHRISRQEMLHRKRAIRRRKRIARFFRISVAVLLLLTTVSFWQDYGGEILPTVNHLYYQLTARYDLPVSKYDFAALQEENETTFAESLSSVDADAENITEALSELVKNNAEAADFVADYPNRQNYLGQSIDLTPVSYTHLEAPADPVVRDTLPAHGFCHPFPPYKLSLIHIL